LSKAVNPQGCPADKRPGQGQPKPRPKCLVGAKGYSRGKFRRFRRRGGSFNKQIYRQRNRVERLFNWLKQFRRIATRYEK